MNLTVGVRVGSSPQAPPVELLSKWEQPGHKPQLLRSVWTYSARTVVESLSPRRIGGKRDLFLASVQCWRRG